MRQWLKNNRGIIVFLLCLGLFRTAVADWNPIPSASMRPTLLEGDVVLVNRLAYDLKVPLTGLSLKRLNEPQRGDVVTFASPADEIRLIKRIVAVPGDRVEIRDGVLHINDVAAEYRFEVIVRENLGAGTTVNALRAVEQMAGSSRTVQFFTGTNAPRTLAPVTVPADHYFMLGDSRDNSRDSRFIGFVHRDRLIGRAHRILVSADITGNWAPRIERTISPIK